MKILVDVQHPAHVHFFKNMIWGFEKEGNDVLITTKDKEITTNLLDAYGFDYDILGKHESWLGGKAIGLLRYDFNLLKIARKFGPDILTGILNESVSHIGFLTRKPSITFTDTEGVKLSEKLTLPFTNAVCTPDCFREDFGKKHVRYRGYHELAYLHPNYFKPDPSIFEDLGISKKEKFIAVRFISWKAVHDIGLHGIRDTEKLKFIKELEEFGRVFVTSEQRMGKKLEKYRISAPLEKIHSILYHSDLYIGEGGTMAVEAAILGTPAIHVESTSQGTPTGERSGNFLELRDKYGLLSMFSEENAALSKAVEILENGKSKKIWKKRREKLLNEKIDVNEWMIKFINNFPDSFYESRGGGRK